MPNKLRLLHLHIGPDVYEQIESCLTYEAAVKILKDAYIKPTNVVHSRHLLATRTQQPGELLDTFLNSLNSLANDCEFKQVTAIDNRNDCVRDAFIRGLQNGAIRTRLLENSSLTLDEAVNQARALNSAFLQSESYNVQPFPSSAHLDTTTVKPNSSDPSTFDEASDFGAAAVVKRVTSNRECYNCGRRQHTGNDMRLCPAQNAECFRCRKVGHYSRVCRGGKGHKRVTSSAVLCSSGSVPTVPITVNGLNARALLDTGSSENFISSFYAARSGFRIDHSQLRVTMASSDHFTRTQGVVTCSVQVDNSYYRDVRLYVLRELCTDVILGTPFLKMHESLHVNFGGTRPTFDVTCSAMHAAPVRLFENLFADVQPIAVKSRNYSSEDAEFIAKEVEGMLKEGIIERSSSPWRAQIVVVKTASRRKRLVVDFSRTINRLRHNKFWTSMSANLAYC